MAFTPGEEYEGLTKAQYDYLKDLSPELGEFLRDNFTPVAGGLYYIFIGEDTAEFLEMLEMEEGLDPDIYGLGYFLYNYSTWSVGSL